MEKDENGAGKKKTLLLQIKKNLKLKSNREKTMLLHKERKQDKKKIKR